MKNRITKYRIIRGIQLSLALLLSLAMQAQITVSGVVTAAGNGEPLIGANIQVENTSLGTVTDIDGSYELEVPSADAVLLVTYIGYQSQRISVDGRTSIDIEMQEDAGLLEEVVVIGYGAQRKNDLTGAVSTIESDDIRRLPTASVQQSLQGKVPGVQVITSSGRPGDGAVVRIRGIGTLNNADPLFVVDGVILPEDVDINSAINPNDIENISILKDASSAAIYGARGANGVVLITTKKGTAGARSTISFSAYYGSQEIVQTIPLTNAREYATLANEAARNEANDPNASVPFPDPDALGEGTNWQDEVYQTAPIQNYNLAFSGATDKINYTISGDYFNQEGIIPGSAYERITIRANSEYQVKDFLRLGHNLSFINIDEDIAPGVVGNTYRADPTVVGFQDGVYGNTADRSSVGNPLGQLAFQNDQRQQGNRLLGNFYLEADFLRDFTFRSSFGLNVFQRERKNFTPEFFVTSQQRADINSFSLNQYNSNNWLWENTLTYSKELQNVRFNVVGGVTAQNNYWEELDVQAQGFPFEDEALRFIDLSDLEGRNINRHQASSWSMLSYLLRANVTLSEKYLLTASIRADGSSRFGINNRFGYFPSFAAGWRITEEPFMDNQLLFSNLKLRMGWGQTGNDRLGSDYPSKATIESPLFAVLGESEVIYNGGTLTQLSNPDLRWENTTQTNIGLEFGFLNNRLSAEIDYYSRTTNDILWQVPIPGSVGLANPPFINAAQVRNSGIDFLLTWQDQKTVGYSLTLTGSTINNEVLRLSDGEEEFRAGGLGFGGELGTITRAGLVVGSFYGFETDGVIQTQEELDMLNARARELTGNPNAFWRSASTRPGDLKFRDQNGDGIIDGDDRVILGDAVPDVVLGLNLSVDYQGFALTVDLAGQYGNQIINSKKMARFGTPNFERSFLDRWTGPGTSNSEPRVTNSGDNYLLTPRFIEDGSFLSLRNVQLSYTLPRALSERFYLSNLRVYVAGSNLKYWTNYSGYTPEIVDGNPFQSGIDRGVYPISRVYTFGLNASF